MTLVLAFAAGVLLLQTRAALPPLSLLAVLATLGLGLLLLRRRLPWSLFWGLLAGGLLGFSWAGWRAQERLADALPPAWEARDIALTGVVAALPQRFERGERFVFAVEQVHTPHAVVPALIQLSWYRSGEEADDPAEGGIDRSLRPGERWRFTVRLKRPHGNANPHGFDYEAWLLERNIRATGSIRARAPHERLADFVAHPAYALERLRDVLRERFLATLPEAPYLGVLIALVIGDQRAISSAQWTVFNHTGITHLVSISGLHVTMVAALLAGLVNFLWRRSEHLMLWLPAQKAAVAAGWLAALCYALIAGFEVPAQRTFYMLTVVALSLWSGRNFGIRRTLLLALLAVLLLDPWAVLATGFWLSFGAVALLFYVGSSRLDRSGRGWGALRQWGVTQWAVTVGSLPLLLLFFQQFSLVSPLANALAIPLVSFIITPLALLFAVLPWPPLLHVDHWLLAQLMRVLEYLSDWPLWQQPVPPLWALLLALPGVAWLLLPRGFPARWLGVCLLLPAFFWPAPRPGSGTAWVDVLDVGQGLAVLVRSAGHNLLYDTGPRYSAEANAAQRVVLPYLRAMGVKQLDALVVSHRDKDHSGGMESIRSALPVGRFISSMLEEDGENCIHGQHWEWEGVRFTLLHPELADYLRPGSQPNNLSCVLRVEAAGQSVLLTGDIEAKDERALIGRAASQLPSTVMVVPHHGGRASSTAEFIAAVGAVDAVFSAGYRNPFGHPRPEVLERHAASRQWRTDQQGAVHIVLADPPGISSWRQARQRYWH